MIRTFKSKCTRTAALLFLAVAAVYDGQAGAEGFAKTGSPALNGPAGTEIRSIIDEALGGDARKPATKESAKPSANDSKNPVVDTNNEARDAAPSTGKSVSASEIAVSKESGTVEIHVNDANLVEVLRMLSMQSNTNILPSKDVRGTVTANLYDVTIKEALDAILQANGFAYREKGNVIYVMSAKEIADEVKINRKMETRVFHLYYTPAANAQTMIKPVLSPEGQVAVTTPATSGIESSGKDTGGNTHAVEDMMVITDYPENLDRVAKVLKDVDKRPQQIIVEATILRASLTEDNSLGVDFSLLGGVNFSALGGAVGTSGPQATQGTLVQPTGVSAAGSTAASAVPVTNYSAAGTGFTQGLPTGGLRVGVVTNNLAVFLQALEEVTDTTVMANPKIMMLNKQKGEVKVARLDPFRGKTTTSESGITQQEVDFLETGTLLIIRPFIGDDGYIRMEVHPEDSTPLPSTAADLPPTKLTTESTSNIMVKDGRTIIIGGLFRETTQTSRSQVPILGNIPGLGNLFKKQQDTTQREEVIILLTPHIIKDDEAYSKASEAEMKEAEKLRVGTRRGMMPWGRERLAETSYEQAVRELNKPNPDRQKVLWHLNCATNLNPKFLEAIDLKQKVSGKEVTGVDNSSMRGFVRRQILADCVTAIPAAPSTQPVSINASAQPKNSIAATPVAEDYLEEAYQEELNFPVSPAITKVAQAPKPEVKPEPKSEPTVSVRELSEDGFENAKEKSDK